MSRHFAVWPENLRAVEAFLACATQWRMRSAGLAGSHFLGLDYGGCRIILDGLGMAMSADDWKGLQVMEAAATAALNARASS